MTREQTQIIKGVAIILMLFLHLFNQMGNVDLCHNLIYVGDTPLVYILSRISNPVSFFLILGGYGLYKVYEKGDRHRWTRVFKLYLHYWIILAIFLTIGFFMRPDRYPGSVWQILSNATSYEPTYNGEMWFLLPYVCLSLISPLFFKAVSKIPAWLVIAGTLFVHLCTSFCISRYGVSFLYHNYWAYDPLLILHLLFNFSLGAMAARSGFFERLRAKIPKRNRLTNNLILLGIITWAAAGCIIPYNFFYAFVMITLLTLVHMPKWLKWTLTKLGNQSMNMWMIHTWFCYYLFHNFIYSFEYTILILLVLIVISYATGVVVNFIARPIERLILTKSEMKEKIAI